MESTLNQLITVPRLRKAQRRFLGGSDERITSADEALVTRLRHEQNIQCLGITTVNPLRTRAHVAKSATVQTPRAGLIGRPDSRSGHRRQQTAENFTGFMTAIRMLMKAYAILWRKLHAHFSEYAMNRANLVLVSQIATVDILERISTKAGRLSELPNGQIKASVRHANLCAPQQARNAKGSNQGGSK